MKKLKIGVVGCGYWGPNLIRNFHSLPDCDLKMVCDSNEKRMKPIGSLYPEVEWVTRYERLLERDRLDAVVIATGLHSHYKLAKASLMAGKHTFIEKPMASSSEECEELIQIAKKKGLVLMVGHTFLFSPAVRKIKEIVDSGDIGEIRYISSRRLSLGIFQKDINVMWDLAPHDLSIILYIIGEKPTSLNCRGNAHITPGVHDVSTLWLNFPKERSAIIQSSWLDPNKIRDMTIVGSKRMIVYDDVTQQEQIKIYDKNVERQPYFNTFAEFLFTYHHGDIYVPFFKQSEPLKIECQHFLDCILHNAKPLVDGQAGLELVRILEAASESLKKDGNPIDLTQFRKKGSRREETSLPVKPLRVLRVNPKKEKSVRRSATIKPTKPENVLLLESVTP